MSDKELTLLILVFVATGLVEVRLNQLFYRSLRAHETRLEPENAWAQRVQDRPTSLIRETAGVTGFRMRLLVHASPYPDTERLRRAALVASVVNLMVFALFAFWPF